MESASISFDVQQKKNHDDVVKWNEYEALRDTLKKLIGDTNDEVYEEIQKVDTKVDDITKMANITHTQVTTLQDSVTTLTQQIAELKTLVETRLVANVADDGSVHNGANAAANNGVHADAHEEVDLPLG